MKLFIPRYYNEAKLTAPQFRVLACLAARSNKDGIAWPSIQVIASDCRLAEKTCWSAIAELNTRGMIKKIGKTFGGSNRYLICNPITPKEGVTEGGAITPKEGAVGVDPITPPIGSSITPPIGSSITPPIGSGMLKQEGKPLNVSKKKEADQPLPFSSEAFSSAWNRWQQHRLELKKKLTPSTAKAQLAKLAEMGEAAAIVAIDHSIEAGWQGIYPPKGTANGQPARKINVGGRRGDITEI